MPSQWMPTLAVGVTSHHSAICLVSVVAFCGQSRISGGVLEFGSSGKTLNPRRARARAFSAIRHAWNLLRGAHVQKESVTRLAFSDLEMFTDQPAIIQTDGDPAASVSRFKIEVAHKALHILVPPTAPPGLFEK